MKSTCEEVGYLEIMEIVYFFLLALAVYPSSEASVPPKIAAIVVPETSVGSDATLVCTLGSGTKPVQFSWTKDGKEVSSQIITNQQTMSTVIIPVVKNEDKGRYSCLVKSSFGEDIKSADLIVSGQLIVSQ